MVFLSYHNLLILGLVRQSAPPPSIKKPNKQNKKQKRNRLTEYACESSSPFYAQYCPLSLFISVCLYTASKLSFKDILLSGFNHGDAHDF